MSDQDHTPQQAGDEDRVPLAYPVGQSSTHSAPPAAPPSIAAPPPGYYPYPPPQAKAGGRRWTGVLLTLLIGSVGMNLVLGLLWLISLGGALGGGQAFRTESIQSGSESEVVAVVPIYDVIDAPMADWVGQMLKYLAYEPSVKAIVLHVDSPGGTVSASDQIFNTVAQFKQSCGKPVIISQGGYATSGGYYISAAGDYIVAEPTTWTGNIGVIMTSFVAQEGLEQKLGVKAVVITSSHTPFKDVPSLFRDMKPAEQQYVQGLVDAAYQRFVDVVASGRPQLERSRVMELANGKVYTADQAREFGLIDQIGYLEDACRVAAEQAQLAAPSFVKYAPRMPGLADLLMGRSSVPALDKLSDNPLQSAQGLLAPRLLYLYHGQMPVAGPRLRYDVN